MEPKKRPVIRQTKASMYRIAKANPLLFKDPTYRRTAESLGLSQDAKIPQSVYWPGCNSKSASQPEALDRTAGSNVSFAAPRRPLKSCSSAESLGAERVVRSSSAAEIRLRAKKALGSAGGSAESVAARRDREMKLSTSCADVFVRPKRAGDEKRQKVRIVSKFNYLPVFYFSRRFDYILL